MPRRAQPEIPFVLHPGCRARRAPCHGGSKGSPSGGLLSCADRAREGPKPACGDFPEKPFQQVRRAVPPSIPTKALADADQTTTRRWRDAPLYLEVVAFRQASLPRRGSAPQGSSTRPDCPASQELLCFRAIEQRSPPFVLDFCRCQLPRFHRHCAARLRPFDTSARLPGSLPLLKRHLLMRCSKGHLLEPW